MQSPTLDSLTVASYRCFPADVTLRLRPITLLFGRNNSGKSALLRTLPLLSDACTSGAQSPWNVGHVGGAGNGGAFKDALWRGSPRRTMTLALKWGGTTPDADVRDEVRLRFDDELDRTVVDKIEITIGGKPIFDGSSSPHTEYSEFESRDGKRCRLSFEGLVPEQGAPGPIADFRKRLRSLSGNVQWLRGVRHEVDRLVPETDSMHRLVMSPSGAQAAEIVLKRPDVLEAVNQFYGCSEIGRYLRSERAGRGLSRLFFDDPEYANWRVELGDVGEGMSQVLPVLVALAVAKRRPGPEFLALEDPDAHLHENARKALAHHIASSVGESDGGLRCVIETHSRTFLLGIQLAVAQGLLKPDDVVVHWLDRQTDGSSVLSETFLDEVGRPSDPMLQRALSEDERLVDELLKFQLRTKK